MSDTLTTTQRAQILDENDAPLVGARYSATSSDTSVVTLGDFGGGTLQVVAGVVGTATVSITQHSDGQVATMEVTVTLDGNVFAIHLAPPVPK